MLASSDKSLPSNLISTENANNIKLLKSAVIFGANASGKTNVLLALLNLKRLVTQSHQFQKGTPLYYNPFKLDNDYSSAPTKYEILFIKNSIKYFYELSYNKENIIEECLYYYPKGRKSTIFERRDSSDYKFTIDIKKQTSFADQTLNNILYLSRSTQLNYEKTVNAFNWFKDDLFIIGPTNQIILQAFTADMLNDYSSKKIILKALKEADIDIDDIDAKVELISNNDLPKDMPEEIKNLILMGKGEPKNIEIKMKHKDIYFDFIEESEGTQRIFSLIGPWIDALKNGKILIVDELDTKLHHFLNEFLIKLFHDERQNLNNAQLIFTTHNINLLDQSLFRRDQIWFTSKTPEKFCTELYSLLEFKQRKDIDIKKRYLFGRYGAIPFIKNNRIL